MKRSERSKRKSKTEVERLNWLASFPSLDPNPIIEITSSGEITYVNLAVRVAFSDLTERGIKHPIVGRILTTVAGFKKSRNQYAVCECEMEGLVYELHCSFIPKTSHVRAYILDITERKKVDRLKNEFVSTVSHELRTPLTVTKAGIDLILDELPGKINEKQKKILTSAKDNIDRLGRIINDLLDISKLEAGKTRVRRETFDLLNLMRRLSSLFAMKAEGKGLKLDVQAAKEAVNIYADEDKITQVLTNLIGNALKFTEKGSITISVLDMKDYIECSVGDTGTGIHEDDLPQVFDKFRQLGRDPGTGEKGTGLGLSIARGIVEMHGGEIRAESTLGKGTKFTFTIPKYTAESFLREEVAREIGETAVRDSKISLITVSPMIDKAVSLEKISSIIKGLGDVIKSNLRRAGDGAFVGDESMTVLLPDCDKPGAKEVGNRLKNALKEYISSNNLAGKVTLKQGSATYPDDAESGEELIKLVYEA